MSIIPTASSPFFWLALCSTQCRDIEQGRQQEPSGHILGIPSLLLTFFHRDSFGREVVFTVHGAAVHGAARHFHLITAVFFCC